MFLDADGAIWDADGAIWPVTRQRPSGNPNGDRSHDCAERYRHEPSRTRRAQQPVHQVVDVTLPLRVVQRECLPQTELGEVVGQTVGCRHRRATDEHRDHALVERQRATQLDADIVVGIVQAPIAIRSDDREPLRTDDREHDVTPLQSAVDAQCEVLAGVDRDDILVDVVLVEPSRQPVAKPACPGRSIASPVADEYAHRRSALSLVDTTPSSSRSGNTPPVTRPLPSVLRGPSASSTPVSWHERRVVRQGSADHQLCS